MNTEDKFYFGNAGTKAESELTVRITKMLREVEQARLSRNEAKAKATAAKVRDMIRKSANTSIAKMQMEELASIMQGMSFAREGKSERFGMAEQVMRDGSVHLDFSAARDYLSKQSDEGLRYLIKDAKAARDAMGTAGRKFHYYTDLVLEAQQELKKRGFSRPGSPDKFDASGLDRGNFAEASKSPMLGKLLAAKVMPGGGWRAVQVGSDTLVISFEDADLARDFGRRASTKGYSATSPVATTGRYWNVEVKNGKV